MGTQLSPIIKTREISIEDLSNKKLAVDSFNMLYQFITTIRQPDGTLLMDSNGNVTSHLSGLFFRTLKLLKNNVKLAFVFDGKAPDLKKEERERRARVKEDAKVKYEEAEKEGNIELMRKYAGRTAILTKELLIESKELIDAFGCPIVQAPSEGEAQASFMVKNGDFYALLSQDTDGLLFGSPKIVKNLSVSARRKKAAGYESVSPELVDLSENLNILGIDNEQLIVVAMLCGTDFNIGGIKGIGPKKALLLIQKHKKDFDSLFKEVQWENSFNYEWRRVYDTIKNMPVTPDYSIKWNSVNKRKIYEILVERHNFNQERIQKALDDLGEMNKQKGLSDFF